MASGVSRQGEAAREVYILIVVSGVRCVLPDTCVVLTLLCGCRRSHLASDVSIFKANERTFDCYLCVGGAIGPQPQCVLSGVEILKTTEFTGPRPHADPPRGPAL